MRRQDRFSLIDDDSDEAGARQAYGGAKGHKDNIRRHRLSRGSQATEESAGFMELEKPMSAVPDDDDGKEGFVAAQDDPESPLAAQPAPMQQQPREEWPVAKSYRFIK